MTLRVELSPEAEARLRQKAAEVGEEIGSYVQGVLERFAKAPSPLVDISGPLAEEFSRSGMSEDGLSELLEQEKHTLRAERRANGGA